MGTKKGESWKIGTGKTASQQNAETFRPINVALGRNKQPMDRQSIPMDKSPNSAVQNLFRKGFGKGNLFHYGNFFVDPMG